MAATYFRNPTETYTQNSNSSYETKFSYLIHGAVLTVDSNAKTNSTKKVMFYLWCECIKTMTWHMLLLLDRCECQMVVELILLVFYYFKKTTSKKLWFAFFNKKNSSEKKRRSSYLEDQKKSFNCIFRFMLEMITG